MNLTLPQAMQQASRAYNNNDWATAEKLCRAVLGAKADLFGALNMLGAIMAQTQRSEEAADLFEKATAAKPNDPEAARNFAATLKNLKRFDEALVILDRAIELQPDFADTYSRRGTVLYQLKRYGEALSSFDRAIELNSKNGEALNKRGNVLKELGRFDEALSSYDQAIDLFPDYPEAHCSRSSLMNQLKRFDEGLASSDQAIQLRPDYFEAHLSRGKALHNLDRLDEALATLDHSIKLNPVCAGAYINRANVLKDLGRFDEAIFGFDQATDLEPDLAGAYLNKSLTLLLRGDFKNGLELYESRWLVDEKGTKKRNFTQPLWLGNESISGKTILLHSEQGFGDTIQFCRYAKCVSDLGARVILEVKQRLKSLLQGLEGIDQLVEKGSELPDFDFHCPLMSLPLAFGTELETIPATPDFHFSDTARKEEWQARLGHSDQPRVGLVWSGSSANIDDQRRSMSLADFVKYLPHGYQYVSLQKDLSEADNVTLSSRADIRHFGEQQRDFSDAAALCELMDLVISVDTSVAHLAGALGRPVWIPLASVADWRWMLAREDSPWYPSVKLFRQEERGDWAAVMQRVALKLQGEF